MISALDTYLGWEQPQHMVGCTRPSWDVAVRHEDNAYRYRAHSEPPLQHACPEENCPHGNGYDQVVVRIVCRSCGAAQVVTGEDTPDTGTTTTSTQHIGYGLPPRQAAGLLLWPGQSWLDFGRMRSAEPHDFVVTRARIKQPAADNIIGQISQGRGKQGGIVWTALAVPHPEGPYGYGQHLRWLHANDGRGLGGTPLRTIAAAAKWIAAQLTTTGGGTGE